LHDPDRAAELQKKWQTALGQLWLAGKHRLLCGDSTSEEDVRRLMNGKRACLFATDPPYLVQYDGTNHPHKWNHPEAQVVIEPSASKIFLHSDTHPVAFR